METTHTITAMKRKQTKKRTQLEMLTHMPWIYATERLEILIVNPIAKLTRQWQQDDFNSE